MYYTEKDTPFLLNWGFPLMIYISWGVKVAYHEEEKQFP